MSRDYKHRLNQKNKRNQCNGPAWLLAGAVLGGILTAAGFLFLPGLLEDVVSSLPEITDPVVDSTPDEAPVEAARPAARKPRFDFYTILPEMEVVVPERDISGKARKGIRQVEQPGTYLLQTGSFREQQQADRLKARLTLLGLDVNVQQVRINNDQTWYRVRVGPYEKLNILNRDRIRLRENGIEAILLRIKQ